MWCKKTVSGKYSVSNGIIYILFCHPLVWFLDVAFINVDYVGAFFDKV